MFKLEKHNINNSTEWLVPGDVEYVVHVGYAIVFPTIIVIGLVINLLALVVVNRHKLTKFHINRYIRFLVAIDTLMFVSSAPASIGEDTWVFNSYSSAFYHSYFGWLLVNIFRFINLYTLAWMSYDRYLAIWHSQKFHKVKSVRVVRMRLIFSVLWITACFLPGIILFGGVQEVCIDPKASAIVKPCNHLNSETYLEHGWISIPGYKNAGSSTLSKVYEAFLAVVTIAIPGGLVVVFSISLVIGLVQKRVKGRRNRQMFQTYALLAMNTSYVLCASPYCIASMLYETKKSPCYSNATTEAAMIALNALLLLWSVLNVFIVFTMNKDYNKELKEILTTGPILNKCFGCLKSPENELELMTEEELNSK